MNDNATAGIPRTGLEHYREAQRLIGMSWEDGRDPENVTDLIARAQVHATLATTIHGIDGETRAAADSDAGEHTTGAANPITDQYLANAARDSYRHRDCPPGCKVHLNETKWAANLRGTLPDVDPAILGKVLLHVGTQIPSLVAEPALQLYPGIMPVYLRNALRNFGVDLINQDTNDTPAGGA